ncbi:MAG: PIN domain-containing protein [Thiobacillaceae bacterium]
MQTSWKTCRYAPNWSSESDSGHWAILRNLLLQTGMAANLTTDAHIAALALEQGYRVYSADNDFRRFPGLKHVNPLSAG